MEAQATVMFSESNVSDGSNHGDRVVKVSVREFDNADYLVVTKRGEDSYVEYSGDVDVSPKRIDYVPNYVYESQSVNDAGDGVILTGAGDTAYLKGLEKGEVVQVFGGLDGRESLMTTYEVEGAE